MQERADIQRYEEDEIDLKELVKTLWHNRVKIVVVTSVITVLAVMYAFVKTPIYEVKSNVQIGYIGKELIADPSTLVKVLNVVFNVEDKVKSDTEFVSEVLSISLNKKIKNFIEIKTDAISNEEALSKNKEVVKYIEEKYKANIEQFIAQNNNIINDLKLDIRNIETLEKKNIQRKMELLLSQDVVKIEEEIKFYKNTKIKALEIKRKLYKKKLKQYTKEIKSIYKNNKNSKDTATLAISSIQMVNYQNLILDAQNKIEDYKVELVKIKSETIPNLERKKENIINDALRKLEYRLKVILPNKVVKLKEKIKEQNYSASSVNVQNSVVVGDYVVKDHPVKPKKKLIVVVAFVTGLILSIFLVFFLEFFKGFKKEDFED